LSQPEQESRNLALSGELCFGFRVDLTPTDLDARMPKSMPSKHMKRIFIDIIAGNHHTYTGFNLINGNCLAKARP
jgi:hypothetical protein